MYGEHVIRTDKVGGGTVGQAYEGDWRVSVSHSANIIFDDIITTGVRKTHNQVAWMAFEYVETQGY